MSDSKAPSGDKIFRVLPRQVDQTIAAALREWLPGQSWSDIKRLVATRRVMINGNLCVDVSRRLRLTDVVKLLTQSAAPPPSEHDVRIRYLDPHVVVVEKPAGMTTTRHAEEREMSSRRRQLQPTLDELLPHLIAKKEKGARGEGRGAREKGREAAGLAPRDSRNKKPSKNNSRSARPVRAVHRLDRETSGLLVFARTVTAEQHLQQQFRVHSTKRRYLAVVQGTIEKPMTIESCLVRDRGDGRRGSTTLPDVGKRSITHVRPVERLGDYTLVECRLETGRTHQIRIHLAENGHPLCGEKVYNQPLFRPAVPDKSGAPRTMLAAVELGFEHPVTGEKMFFESKPPRDFADFVRRLRGK